MFRLYIFILWSNAPDPPHSPLDRSSGNLQASRVIFLTEGTTITMIGQA